MENISKILDDNLELSYNFIKEILIGIKEAKTGKLEEFTL